MERQMADELQFHLDVLADDLMARHNVTRDEAMRRARLEFGSLEKTKEEVRQSFGLRVVDECRSDVRFALRTLSKNRAFAATSIAILAPGIGANTAVFSALEAFRLRNLPVSRPEQLVVFQSLRMSDSMMAGYAGESHPGPHGSSVRSSFSELTLNRLRDSAKTLSHVFGIVSMGQLNVVADS